MATSSTLSSPPSNSPAWLTIELKEDFLHKLRTEWKLGDPLPLLVPLDGWLGMLPEHTKEVMELHPERRSEFEKLLFQLGDSGRNQLAMPVEYLAHMKLAVRRFKSLFSDLDPKLFGMHVFPEVNLFYDPSAKYSSVVGVVRATFIATVLPEEKVWKKSLQLHQHMIEVKKLQHSFYLPKTIKTDSNAPQKIELLKAIPYTIQHILENTTNPHIRHLGNFYGLYSDETNAFGIESFDKKSQLEQSDFWKEMFGYLENNGNEHLVLSDQYDYTIGKPEILLQKALYTHGGATNTDNIENWFKPGGNAACNLKQLVSKTSTHPGLPAPHYAMKKYKMESIQSIGNNIKLKDCAKAFLDPQQQTQVKKSENHTFADLPSCDKVCSNKFIDLSQLSSTDCDMILINMVQFLRPNSEVRQIISKQIETINAFLLKTQGPNSKIIDITSIKPLDLAQIISPFMTTFEIKVVHNTTNYHFMHYECKPPIHPCQEEIIAETLRQKRLHGCLPPPTYGECFYQKDGATRFAHLKDGELPPLISDEDLLSFEDLGIYLPRKMQLMTSKEIPGVINEIRGYKHPYWNQVETDQIKENAELQEQQKEITMINSGDNFQNNASSVTTSTTTTTTTTTLTGSLRIGGKPVNTVVPTIRRIVESEGYNTKITTITVVNGIETTTVTNEPRAFRPFVLSKPTKKKTPTPKSTNSKTIKPNTKKTTTTTKTTATAKKKVTTQTIQKKPNNAGVTKSSKFRDRTIAFKPLDKKSITALPNNTIIGDSKSLIPKETQDIPAKTPIKIAIRRRPPPKVESI